MGCFGCAVALALGCLIGTQESVSGAVNLLGLAFDIVGACLIYKYGLPSNPPGLGLVALQVPTERSFQRYDRLGKFGLGLLILGFLLQFVSNLL